MAALKSKRSNGGGFRLVAGREKFGVVSDNLMRAGVSLERDPWEIGGCCGTSASLLGQCTYSVWSFYTTAYNYSGFVLFLIVSFMEGCILGGSQ